MTVSRPWEVGMHTCRPWLVGRVVVCGVEGVERGYNFGICEGDLHTCIGSWQVSCLELSDRHAGSAAQGASLQRAKAGERPPPRSGSSGGDPGTSSLLCQTNIRGDDCKDFVLPFHSPPLSDIRASCLQFWPAAL